MIGAHEMTNRAGITPTDSSTSGPAAATCTTFRALWPIVDSTIPLPQLIAEATADLPHVANRARAEASPRGRWSVARSVDVPGSGRVTEHVLVYEAPARVKRRKWADDPVLRQRNGVTV